MIQTLTIGLSAFLLFMMQPMISRIILPDFGGGSSIWLTTLIFYQALLLGGYAFSHLVASRMQPRRQALLYGGLIVFCLVFFIPIHIVFHPGTLPPVLQIFRLLLAAIGLPYFILSTTSPMVQHWISAPDHGRERNPYILYGVSNAGSLAGLLSYPTLIEPRLTNSQQTGFLSWGFSLYVLLLLICLGIYLIQIAKLKPSPASRIDPRGGAVEDRLPSWSDRLTWLGQSMVPSAALLVFTYHLSVDIVNFPLLWVIPLALYLISFVVCFLFPGVSRPTLTRTLLSIIPVLAMVLSLRSEFHIPFAWKIVATCFCLFAICMFFHGNLERSKPHARRLTAFYLYLSLGGCLGGFLAGIVAPLVFKSPLELYIVIIAAFYFMLEPYFRRQKPRLMVFFRVMTSFLLLLSFVNEEILFHHSITYRTRSFYGAYSIRDLPAKPGEQIAARILSHGTTIHGGEARNSFNQLIPISYFHEYTGVGRAFLSGFPCKNIGVVGLGTGMVSLYGRPGQAFDFFEIDPRVVQIANERFSNLRASQASIRFIIGDARLKLREIPDRSYDMLILDAFTSGAIPTHLLTIEAMNDYLRVLRPDGIILFHITNRYLDMVPVLHGAAEKLGLYMKYHQSREDLFHHRFSARWAILARGQEPFDQVTARDDEWQLPAGQPILWTDDFYNLWSVIQLTD